MNAEKSVDPVPNGMHTVTPHLVCAGASEAISFYQKAFGAEECCRLDAPDGKIMNASIRIGDSMLMLVDEMPGWGALGPSARGGTSVTLHLQVEDADALFERAVNAGATVKLQIADMFWGDRYGIVVDPYGHEWSIATHVRDVSPEELAEVAKDMKCGAES
ncbi:MAG: VOC family protein [Verrucomicrobiota bacterium]